MNWYSKKHKMKNLLETTTFQESNHLIIYEAQKHWISLVIPILFIVVGIIGILPAVSGAGILKFIGFFLLFLLFKGLKALLSFINIKIYLTENYLTIIQGVFGKTTLDIPIQKLEGIILNQNFLGKMLNFGTLTVTTGEVAQQYIIKNPEELRDVILNNN
jgi:hypothetical protein